MSEWTLPWGIQWILKIWKANPWAKMDLPLIVESLGHRGLPKVCKSVLVICEAGPAWNVIIVSKSSPQTEVPKNTDSSASCLKLRLIEWNSTRQETKAILHIALLHVFTCYVMSIDVILCGWRQWISSAQHVAAFVRDKADTLCWSSWTCPREQELPGTATQPGSQPLPRQGRWLSVILRQKRPQLKQLKQLMFPMSVLLRLLQIFQRVIPLRVGRFLLLALVFTICRTAEGCRKYTLSPQSFPNVCRWMTEQTAVVSFFN